MSVLLELRRVGRHYDGPAPVAALTGVDLTLQRGEHLAITGGSGAGKSTLLGILGLLDRPTTGSHLLDGVDVGTADERERARLRATSIGFVFQSFHLLADRTVAQNVALAFLYGGLARGVRRRRVDEALHRVGLAHRADFLPSRLSGGERQRAAVARAVCTRPSLLLADEPTGNLDRRNADSVLELFSELHADGLTIVTITHDPRVAAAARRQATLDSGRLTLPELVR
ncbi:ABC transporter ATP-binding protein [Herbiconiux sp. KACC 21604]|uniref:ABC transporter ATP-binding protein n=1 Tax=unclassified Herbiconiux TaxID=2618217 RepID=UPI001491FB26|nr:ABC transporter ATP-binding protein [Herbiconiux sp. SALV-R1]QJU53496.1 ABC transporter ATP-binding protein [Herbiconiux sp. SALV-R1]WPO88472.1 ABC transporter ATP-binding protein [Herbiconiux sp. KACC 21604]